MFHELSDTVSKQHRLTCSKIQDQGAIVVQIAGSNHQSQ